MKITTSFSIEKTIYNIAKKQADKENRKFSNLVETALIEYLKSRKANKNAEHPANGWELFLSGFYCEVMKLYC